MAAASIYVLRESPSCLLPLQKSLHGQQVGLIQAPFKLLLLLWVLVYVRLCVCPLRIKYLLPTYSFLVLQNASTLAFKARYFRE